MTLPSYWRQAAFSVVESADLLRVPEDTLRTWMARCPFDDFLGTRTAGRIFLSGLDLYFWSLVRDLSAFGVGLRVAMSSVRALAEAATSEMPAAQMLVIRKRGPGVWDFEMVDDPEFNAASALIIPLRALAVDLIERAAAVYATEGA
ncbi:hypothetical protein PY650_31010 [Rhizobium calliandrae]|uniref:Uncharacterized protein n=1 Tax=Rhizobium calliandrae TaxID=1312182 RepID=A0ABT7KPN3_9HYPH|nr:hypothetical protein [Rhizobium calliandrae]MDL2409970.1 hypothetical protein [Rhizobium calliandrae]